MQATPFWLALILLATRDPSEVVYMEAIRQLAGSSPRLEAAQAFQHLQSQEDSESAVIDQPVAQNPARMSSPFSPTARALFKCVRSHIAWFQQLISQQY